MAVSMCSVTSQREPSPSVASGSKEFLKRPLQHDLSLDVDTHFEPAVKMKCSGAGTGGVAAGGGGGGRRKQSKPIRVRSDTEPSPIEDLVVDMKLSATRSSPPGLNGSPAGAAESGRERPPVDTLSYDVDDQKRDLAAAFPTKYHQLGSELKQEAGLGPYAGDSGEAVRDDDGKTGRQMSQPVDSDERRSALDTLKRSPRHEPAFVAGTPSWNHSAQLPEQFFMSKSDCLPTNLSMRSMKAESPADCDVYSAQSSATEMEMLSRAAELRDAAEQFWEGSDAGSGADKSRIFHPDAFCDICNREFCNKYFLKTHRANKHGIYDASSGAGGDPGAFTGSAVPPSMSGLVFSQATALAGVETPNAAPAERERATSSSVSCSPASSLSGLLPMPQLPSSLGILPYDDAAAPPAPPPPPPAPARGTDMEDYCDICQKHFCNKYYLRKHRQDVHGLSPADVAARRIQSDFARGSSDAAEGSSTAPHHFPLRISSSSSSSTLPPPSALSNFPMFLPPPFGAPLPVVPPFLPGAAGLGFGSLQFDGAGGEGPSKLSPSSTSQAQPLGRGAASSLLPGVMGADAYMNLFRKELLGGYLINNGERDVTAAIVAAAAAAAASGGGGDPAGPPPPRLPPLPTGSDPSAPADAPGNPDTFAEMLQRIGARIGKKSDGLGALQHDLLRLNGLGSGTGRPPGSLTSTPSSSSTSSSSRLVDRVVCDICNKEVCNKYFLKTHKMKVHGWDPNTSAAVLPAASLPSTTPAIAADAPPLVKSEPHSSPTQPPPPPLMYFPSLSGTHVDKPLPFPSATAAPESVALTPKEAELQKMGIDPEAYCEICRKEFCSKYFLRTHRQNIHGIRDSAGSPSGSYHGPSGPGAPLFASTSQPFPSVVLPPSAPPSASLPSSLPANCSTSPASASSLFLFGGGAAAAAAGLAGSDPCLPADGHAVEQRSWKWKEPVNATRVSCTLCNKVLCNKYFLRTHMAKRHGVTVDTRLQPAPPARDPIQPSTNGVLQQFGSSDGASADVADAKDAECCADVVKAGAAVNLVLAGRTSADVQTVTARTWQVPADDTTPPSHSDSSSQQSDPGATTAATKAPCDDASVKCPLCASAVADRDVLRHLTSVHHVDEHVSVSLVESAGSPASTDPGSAPRPPAAGSAMRRRRQFRCAFCRERFRTRVHCELHARAAHPRACVSSVEVAPPPMTDAVERASPPPVAATSTCASLPAPVFATALDAGDAARAQMLPYVLRESPSEDADSHFCTALVYLPTLRPLTSPTTITFTLTPIVQP